MRDALVATGTGQSLVTAFAFGGPDAGGEGLPIPEIEIAKAEQSGAVACYKYFLRALEVSKG